MKNKIIVSVIAVFFLGLSIWNVMGEKLDYSESERRVLAQVPKFGENFVNEWETYVADHFPSRDVWRSIKSYMNTELFCKKDYHDIYQVGEHLVEMEYPMNTKLLDYAIDGFKELEEKYFPEQNVYIAVIPDKNRYLAAESGHLSMDYEAFSKYISEGMKDATYIEMADLLSAEDYYYTDMHWRQEKIVDVAQHLGNKMGVQIEAEYKEQILDVPFQGVYVGQYGQKSISDEIKCLSNDAIEHLQIEGADAVYDLKKGNGKDPYEVFLSGNQPIVKIKNPQIKEEKRLIIFRDSFASSLAPLLATGYSEMVLVDLRYVSNSKLEEFISFENADVLFLYSTTMLNRANSMNL